MDLSELSETTADRTPLAPSVEKAYYRKCIELKRRLNEVESANDELKIRRVRLDRGIMKMRLERAFLLDELRKRMEHNVDDSTGSADEGMATPPPDRPHRDKRRRPESSRSLAHPQTATPHQPAPFPSHPPMPRVPSQAIAESIPLVPGPGGVSVPANATDAEGRYIYVPPHELGQRQAPPSYPPQPPQHGNPYESRPSISGGPDGQTNGLSVNGAEERERDAPINRTAGATGEALSAGPSIQENANGERKIISSTSAENANAESEQQDSGGGPTGGGFTAVNQ